MGTAASSAILALAVARLDQRSPLWLHVHERFVASLDESRLACMMEPVARFTPGGDPAQVQLNPVHVEIATKTGVSVALCTLISWWLHFDLAYVAAFKTLIIATIYRDYDGRHFVKRGVIYFLTALLFVVLTMAFSGNRFLLFLMILIVTAPYLYVSSCSVFPMPTGMGGPVIMIPMTLAWTDPEGAIHFSIAYFGQMLLALTVVFLTSHAWGSAAERDQGFQSRAPALPLWPIGRLQISVSARPYLASILGTVVFVLFDPPGKLQIAITALVLTLSPTLKEAGHKATLRLGGCVLGALVGMGVAVALSYVAHVVLLLLVLFAAYSVFSYLTLQEGDHWYMWMQAGIAFAMMVVTQGPAMSDTLIEERFSGILIGAVVAAVAYLVPLPSDRPQRPPQDEMGARAPSFSEKRA